MFTKNLDSVDLTGHQMSPLAGGVKSAVHRTIQKEYASNLFCLGCTYFQQTKGHFGYCKEGSKKTVYDGSRKDSACLCYREKPNLEVVEYVKPQIITPNDIKRKYNEKIKTTQRTKQISRNYEWKKKPTNFKFGYDMVLGLPYATTADIRNRSGFYKHKTPSKIIEYSFYLMDKGYSLHKISKMIESSYGYKVSHKAIWNWAKKFKPELKFPQGRPHDDEWKETIRQSVILFHKLNPGFYKGRRKGIPLRRKWMLEMQRKYADNPEVSRALEKEILLCQ